MVLILATTHATKKCVKNRIIDSLSIENENLRKNIKAEKLLCLPVYGLTEKV